MRWNRTFLLVLAATLAWTLVGPNAATAADEDRYKTADGLAVFLGDLPAAMIQGHPAEHPEAEMHSGVPPGRHDHHVMAALFDAATGERIEDAAVEARVAPLGLAGVTRTLEPMAVADTVTYGNYFTLRRDGPHRIALTISRAEAPEPVRLEFAYDHHTR